MALTDQQHTIRFTGPHLIEATRATLLSAPMYLDGALVAPTGGGSSTVTVTKADGTDLVTGATVVVTASVGEYTVLATATALTDLGEGWSATWTLVAGGVTYVVRNDAAVVRRRLWPVVSDVDLYRRVRSLDPASAAVITTQADYQDQLDEAWSEINRRLIGKGNRPNLIMSPSSLREVHLLLTLALIFEDLAAQLNGAYAERPTAYRGQWEAAWSRLSFLYASTDGEQPDSNRTRRSATPTVWLGGGGGVGGRWTEPR